MMRKLLQRFQSRAGLDIGGHSVKAVRLSPAGQSWRLSACAVFPRPRPQTIPVVEELREIGDVLRRQGFKGSEFVVAAPLEMLRTGVLELPPRVPGLPIDQIARAEFARMHKCDAANLELSYWELPAAARASKTTQVMAIGLTHADADPWLQMLAAAGLSIRAVDAHTSALGRACFPLAMSANAVTVSAITGILDLGFGAAVLALMKNGLVIYERRIAEGGLALLHQAIARRFGGSSEVVDHVLRDVGMAGRKLAGESAAVAVAEPALLEAADLIANHFAPLIQELHLAFSYAQHQYADAPVELVLASGGGACVPGLCAHLSNMLGVEVRAALPQATIECAPDVQDQLSPVLMPAIGLAQFGGSAGSARPE